MFLKPKAPSRRLLTMAAFFALLVQAACAQFAWAAGTADVAATATDDKVMIDSEAYYLTYNPNAPSLSQSDMSPGESWVFWGTQSHDTLSDTLNYYTKTKASNNASAGASISATYRNVGTLQSTGDESWSEPVDIKITMTVTKSEANPSYLAGDGWWNDWCDIQFHQRLTDGWTTTNMPEFDMVVEFFRAGTGSKLDLNGSIWVLGQSLDDGEGFMVQGASAGYVSSDAPVSNPDSGNVNPAVAADSRRHTIPGSHLYEIGALGSGWYGFIGAPVIYSSDTTNWAQARNYDVYDSDGWLWQRKHGLNYMDRNGQGADLSTTDLNANNTSWKRIGSTLIENTFKWRSGALEAQLTAGTIRIKHFAIMKPDSSPASANAAFGFGSAGMAADNSWDVREAHLITPSFATWGSYGYKYFTQLFAPQTAFVPRHPTKAVDKSEAEVGETVTYTIKQKVNEHGSDCADGYTYSSLLFEDVLPEGLRYTSHSIIDPSGNDIGEKGTFSLGDDYRTLSFAFDENYLANELQYDGGFITVTVNATVLPQAAGTTLVNKASFTFNGSYKLDTNEVETRVPTPQLDIPTPTKAVDKDIANVGETVTYTVKEQVIDRQGFPYSSMRFYDVLPAGLTFKSLKVEIDGGSAAPGEVRDITDSAGRGGVDGQAVTYDFSSEFVAGGGLAYCGETLTFTIATTVDESAAGTTLENEASVFVNDANLKTNKVVTKVPVIELPAPTKAVDKEEAHPSDRLTYTIVQPLDDLPSQFQVSSLFFEDELPSGLAFDSLAVLDADGVDITASAGTTTARERSVSYTFKSDWLAESHPLGKSLTFRIEATIDSGDPSTYGGLLVNDADITFNDRYKNTTNKVETRVSVPPATPVPLPLTGESGISPLLGTCTIAVLAGVVGLAIRLLRPRKTRLR